MLIASFGFLVLGVSAGFKYVGTNEAGAEFGSNIPGVVGTDYTFPTTSSIDYFVQNGMNTFRVPFLWERIQRTLNGPLDATYSASLDSTVNYITNTKGVYVLIDVHNYARYNDAVLGSGLAFSAFADLWTKLATRYKSNPKVLFGLMNEPNTMPTQDVETGMQAAINAIRATGATNLITVPGNSWTGVHSWTDPDVRNDQIMININDPGNNMMFEMHQYFDSDFSGTGSCTSNFNVQAIFGPATNWLRANGKTGFLGEFGIEKSAQCLVVLQNTMAYLQANSDVWQGWTWWAAGPWWGNYDYSLEKGVGDAQLAVLKNYMSLSPSTPSQPSPSQPSPSQPSTTGKVKATTGSVPAPAPIPAPAAMTTGRISTPPARTTTGIISTPPTRTTTGRVSSPAPTTPTTPAPTTPSQQAASGSCTTLRNMVCVGTTQYQTCTNARVGNVWSAVQKCPSGRVCSPAGDFIYCL